MEQVTYGALKKPSVRVSMLEEDMVSIGTQSGNYGLFTEQARVLTLIGATEMLKDVDIIAIELGCSRSAIFDLMPTLKKLLAYT